MADLGLILGAALAGGAAGAGGAAKDALKSQQDYMQKDDLIHLQNDLDEQKQLRIQEANHAFLADQQGKLFGHEDTMQSNQQTFLGKQGDLNRQNTLDVTTKQGENAMAVEQVRAATEKAIAAMNQSTSLAVARMAHAAQSIQSDASGALFSVGVDKDGTVTTTQLKGPDGKPLQGPKNIDAATGMFVKALTDTADLAARNGDTEGHDMAIQRLNMLLSGTPLKDVMGLAPSDVPNPRALAALQTPEGQAHYAEFKAKWPKFAASMENGGQVPKAVVTAASGTTSSSPNPFADTASTDATSTGTAGTPPLPGANAPAAPVQQVNRPPLVRGQLPPAAAGWQGRPEVTPPADVAPIVAPAPTVQPAPAPPTFAQSVKPAPFAAPAPNVLDPVGQGLIAQQFIQR